jgi:aminoglycoside phosphotransferase (APT) family kinase protein
MAMIALEALHRADVTSNPFAFFGQAYRFVRRCKVAFGELFGPSLLSSEQRIRLNWLLGDYTKASKSGKKALVHGDLHASNLVVNSLGKSLGFVDLELLHIGDPVTNFAQLWIGFHFADPLLGQRFYQRYARQFPDTLDEQFDASVRAEIALRCYSMIRSGKRTGNIDMDEKSRVLLGSVLDDRSFEEACLSGGIC